MHTFFNSMMKKALVWNPKYMNMNHKLNKTKQNKTRENKSNNNVEISEVVIYIIEDARSE